MSATVNSPVYTRPLVASAARAADGSVHTATMLHFRKVMPFATFIVADESMTPTLQPGDGLLIWRGPFRSAPRVGDIVVARDPQEPGRLLVKRLTELSDGMATLLGDNPRLSRDSRSFGPVPERLIVGRISYRYLPGERRGSL